jgi:alkaline phosphatase D
MTETPVVAAMTTSSCKIAVRVSGVADVAVEYADNARFSNSSTTSRVTTSAASDYTATLELSGLNANDIYWYRVLVDGVVQSTSYVHKFTTFASSGPYKFAVFADVAPTDRLAAAYRNANLDGALFALQIGDFDHRNPATLAAARTMHRDMKDTSKLHGDKFNEYISSKMAVVHVWDDHDYCGNDEDKNCPNKANALQAFDEHWPTYARPNAAAGLWHSFVVGDAEFFVLDLRSQRDDNGDTDNSDKSMLDGDGITNDQKDWLKDGLSNSTTTWKFLVSSVTGNPTARPQANDAWRDFSTEREELQDFIEDNSIEGVIMLTGDLHTGGAIDDGTYNGFSLPEMCVPHTNLVTGNITNLGTWSEGVTSGDKGYGLVTVSSSGVTLEVYGAKGDLRRSLTVAP